eukprot:1159847-Pelagomonas_calceolata.AAC.2
MERMEQGGGFEEAGGFGGMGGMGGGFSGVSVRAACGFRQSAQVVWVSLRAWCKASSHAIRPAQEGAAHATRPAQEGAGHMTRPAQEGAAYVMRLAQAEVQPPTKAVVATQRKPKRGGSMLRTRCQHCST